MRVAILALFFGMSTTVVCQPNAPAAKTPETSTSWNTPMQGYSIFGSSTSSPSTSIEERRPPALWHPKDGQVYPMNTDGYPFAAPGAKIGTEVTFQSLSSKSPAQSLTFEAQNWQPLFTQSPGAKLEPIPTQWPDAKLETIPVRWPDLKIVPITSRPNTTIKP